MANNKEQKVKPYPYKVDYNDHFETPLVAYQDILPLLRFLLQSDNDCLISTSTQKAAAISDKNIQKTAKQFSESSSTAKNNNNCTILSLRMYDPYYCNGRTLRLLQSLGFQNVIHQKRDFYKDVANRTVPIHDVLVTNPPYSQNHKEQCLAFAMEQLFTRGRPFFILIPNYVANKEYWRTLLTQYENTLKKTKEHPPSDDDSSSIQVVYLIPPEPYEYEHPEGTGHEIPPFASLWFCGFSYRRSSSKSNDDGGGAVVTKLKEFWNRRRHEKNKRLVRLATSIQELVQLNAVPTMKRPNPKQRKKKRRSEQQQQQQQQWSSLASETNVFSTQSTKNKTSNKTAAKSSDTIIKKSRYRGKDGKRTRKRF